MLNVGLVGFGFAGKTFHAPVIRVVQGLRLTTIVQRHGGGAPDTRYAAVEFVRSVDELLSRAVDLVVIATPNTSHHPIAKQCLQAGRHVVIDKPFTTTVPEADELVQLGAAQRRVLSIYQNRRYVGDFVTLRALLSQAALGGVPGGRDRDAERAELYGELTGPEDTRAIPAVPAGFTHHYGNGRGALLGKAQLAVTPEQARNVIRGLELAVASSQQRCVVPWSV